MRRFIGTIIGLSFMLVPTLIFAKPPAAPWTVDAIANSVQFTSSIKLLLSLTSISFVPFFLMSTTSFLRFVIVFSLLRTALGTGQSPPNPILIAMSLFMTIYVMSPVMLTVHSNAIEPYNKGQITQPQAFVRAVEPFHTFMLKHTREADLALFMEFAKVTDLAKPQDVPLYVLIPSFVISELKSAFQIAFLIFVPFVVIDLVVSNILLTLGMFMLSPVMISLPFKILLFVLVDGWNLIVKGLLLSFQ